MKIKTEKYLEAVDRLPKNGQLILGHQKDDQIVVYQAYNQQIADYAVKNQILGGDNYSYNRMSWIKPNFLWMMYRCGWASKENQERVLAFWISKSDFNSILDKAVFSSYNPTHYTDNNQWKVELAQSEVRLQWDPDHDPFGTKLTRRAIQIGMKGDILSKFGKQFIRLIEDITPFVKEQKVHVDNNELDKLVVPFETIYDLEDVHTRKKIGLD